MQEPTTMIPLPTIEHGPNKPKRGEPCNGCGYCCAAEVCEIGLHAFGASTPAPCPALEFRDGRFWCGIVRKMDEVPEGKILRMLLGIELGCDADDFEPSSPTLICAPTEPLD
jgi:hypothetical protein